MRDKQRVSSSSSPSPSSSSSSATSIDSTLLIFNRGGSYNYNYKPWALAAILLLALLSISACSITLKQRTAGTLNLSSEHIESVLRDDLDVLEVEERKKVVRHMWDVHTNSKRSSSNLGLPKFWQEAFEAAYEYLVSDDPGVRNFAVLEIAKMSMMSNDLESSPSSVSQSQGDGGGGAISRGAKQGEQNMKHNSNKARK